jgi:uncharacterized circularly permuted ATP-grasp superfamily protein
LIRPVATGEDAVNLETYETESFYDEMFGPQREPRRGTRPLVEAIYQLPSGELRRRHEAAEKAMHRLGITFNVYGGEEGAERIWPFDIIPRVIESAEWDRLEAGLKQRIHAINAFVDDIYHDQKIIKDRVIPDDLIRSAAGFLPPCMGLNPPKGIWCHITGSDIVRDAHGRLYVLEDNLRVPSGVSYVLANRSLMKQTFPEVFSASRVRPISDYPTQLLNMLHHVAPDGVGDPRLALLTPGRYNSAYFEHSFLAQQMGVQLVEGGDLAVADGYLVMRTTGGPRRVDVLYRRVNDDYLDPRVFRPESMLGLSGLMDVYRKGRITLVNAPGTGVADDKVVYAYIPAMIKYYLGEEALLPNVPTLLCSDPVARAHVLDHLDQLVVKPANESGGYGMLIGPASTAAQRQAFAERIQANPRNYIAQPTLSLSRAPVIVEDHLEGRHVDLRPFVLFGEDSYVLPGGLTRVALRKGSLVVNSSQGGGSKDTWVLASTNGTRPAALAASLS